MRTPLANEEPAYVSTGHLPTPELVTALARKRRAHVAPPLRASPAESFGSAEQKTQIPTPSVETQAVSRRCSPHGTE